MSEYKYSNEYEEQETKKYEGTYTAEEVELNRRLYNECLKPDSDFALIEELLEKGADPLGATAEYGWGLLEHVYGEIVIEAFINEEIDLPRITELFLKHGMDVSSPRVPYDGENSMHAVEYIPQTENGIRALKLFLDYGIGVEDVGMFWGRYITDQINVHHDDPNSDEYREYVVYAMKMIMLIASYDHIREKDEALCELIGASYNTYDIHLFRNWNGYRYEFDTSRCKISPQLHSSVVSIYDVKSDEPVWRFGIYLKDGEWNNSLT